MTSGSGWSGGFASAALKAAYSTSLAAMQSESMATPRRSSGGKAAATLRGGSDRSCLLSARGSALFWRSSVMVDPLAFALSRFPSNPLQNLAVRAVDAPFHLLAFGPPSRLSALDHNPSGPVDQ